MNQENKNIDFGRRLASLREKAGLTSQDKFAEVTGFKKGSIKNWETGSIPNGTMLIKIAEFFSTSVDWLLLGKSEKNDDAFLTEEFVYIPKVLATLSAGWGTYECSDEIEGYYSFRRDWLRRKGQTSKMVLMDVTGDSMYPIINDGDTIMIDTSKTLLYQKRIYAVRVEDLLYIKYIDRSPGKFILTSHNPQYSPIEIDEGYLNETSFSILGMVVWWCHDERTIR